MFQKNTNKADTQKILFIDESVLDAADLLVDLQPGYQVVRLSSNLDPIIQITQALSAHSFVNEITILAHAQPGQLNFSNSTLDLATLHNRDHEFANWDQWLTADAKICIYACSLASGEIGQEFIHTLKNLTGAEIASSSLPIGKVGTDQNWNLDRFTESFEVLMPFSLHSTDNYAHTLAPEISISGSSAIEGTVGAFRQIEFVVTLSEPAIATTDISYRTLDGAGTATGGVDFVEEVSFVRILAGQSSATFNISVFPDTADEADESVVVELFNPTNAVFADGAETLRSTGVILDDDGTANDRALFVSQVQVVEGNDGSQQAVFEVQLSGSSTSSITLNYATADGSAKESQDYQAQNGTVTFAPGETLKTVAVPLLGDAVAEANEFFNLVVTPTSATNNGVDGAVGTAVILDDDTSASLPEISISGSSTIEGTVGAFRQIEFVVTLSEPATATTDISYRTLDGAGTATGGVDFVEEVSFVRILAGQSSATFNISVFPDTADEADESVVVELFNPTNAVFADGAETLRSTGVILDDDGTANDRALFVSQVQVVEGNDGSQQAVFEVQLSGSSTSSITLNYATADGSAKESQDYQAQNGTVTFAPGETLKTVAVPLLGDAVAEANEFFNLVVTPTSATNNGVDGAVGTAVILDDDTSASLPEISISGSSAIEGTVGAFRQIEFVVTLSEPAIATTDISYRTLDGAGTATGGVDFVEEVSFVRILAGQSSATFNISVFPDTADEADESVVVELFNPTNAVFADGAETLRSTGVILDDDGTANDRALFVSQVQVVEGNDGSQQAVFEVQLSGSSTSSIMLNYATADGSAKESQDYQAQNGTVTFAPGETLKTVAVPLLGDAVAEANEFFNLVVTPTSATNNGVDGAVGTAVILDDDTSASLPEISISGSSAIEGTVGAFRQIEFVVTLSEPAIATTDISYRTLDGAGTATGGVDFVEEVSFVRILAGQSSATFNISVFPDTADEADESVVVELFNPTNAVFADGAETLRSTGVILDDDGTANDRALFVSQVQVVEGNDGSQQAVFEVQLSGSSTSSITLNYATADGSAKESQDYQAQNGTVTFAPGETLKTVAVPLLGDAVAEANEFFNLVVTPTSATNNGVDGAVGTAVILDDDTSASLPEISISGSSAIEGTVGAFRQIEFVVTLSEPAIATTDISYRTLDGAGTATGGVDFVEEVSFVRILAGQSSATFNISVFPDTADEADESVVVELFNPTNAVFADDVDTLQATGIILDDDGTGNDLGLFVGNAQIVEGENNFTREVAVPIQISRPSDQTLTFDYQTADGSAQAGQDYAPQTGTVTFLPGQTLAAVFVPISGDDVIENDETFTLTVTPNAAIANGSDGATGTVTIIDGDVLGADNISPLLIDSTPQDDTIDFVIDSDLQLNFDEEVTAGSGNIVISNGTDTRVIDINDASQVTFNGSKVDINPLDDLIPNTSYNIQMPSGVITDIAGNAYAGISDPTTLNFTTVHFDLVNPLLVDSTPQDDAIDFVIDSDLQLNFDEEVTAGSGNIVISNGTDTRVIDINDASQVTFNGSKVDINPLDDLIPNTSYNIQMPSGVITDIAGNAYAGISDPTTLNFTTIPIDIDSPLLDGSFPADDSIHQVDHDILLFFNEAVTAGSGDIVISNGIDTRTIDITDASQVSFDGFGGVYINPTADLILNTTYNIQMASGVITDFAGNAYAGISDPTTLDFTTISTEPLLDSSNPFDDSTHQIDHDIRLNFNEVVTAGSGSIVISNGTDIRTIDINDSSQVTFNGSKVEINPIDDLIADTDYNVQIASGVITDTVGNSYAGISDPTTLNFTTIPIDINSPLLDFSNPSDNSTHQVDHDIQLFFNEGVTAGSGDIVISNGTDTRTIDINDASQVTIDGFSVFINPTTDLALNTTYNIQMASGVITDFAGNAYGGISDPTTLNFTTISTEPLLVVSTPPDDSIDFLVDEDIKLFFNEEVTAGSGNIVISNGIDTRSIDVNDASQVMFNGSKVVINPADDLIADTNYNVQIASGVITDIAGTVYAGISDPTTLNFTTIPTFSVNAGEDISLDEGDTLTRTIDFFDVEDTNADGWTYSVDYGDGSTVETGSIAAGVNSFDISHAYADGDATHDVSVTVTDVAGDADTKGFAVTVNNVVPTIALAGAPEVDTGVEYSLNLGAITDPGDDTVTSYIVDWGDGSSDTFNTAGDVIHTYAATGNNTIRVDLVDEDGTHTDAGTLAIEVTPPPLGVSVNAGGDATVNEGNLVSRTITFTDGEDTNADGWTYSVDYGDGSAVETGSVAAGVNSFDISHAYADGDATHDVSVTVTDVAGDADTKGFAVTVNNVVPTIALAGALEVNTGEEYSLNLGAITDPGDDTVTSYIVDWGDGSSDTFATAGDVTHTYATSGNYTISVDLEDEDGTHTDVGAGTLAVEVTSPPPGVSVNAGGDATVNEGNLVGRTITFTDSEDTNADGWTYSVNYGDGSAVETGSIAAGVNSFDISHAYADGDATHDVSVTVTDVAGDADTKGFAVTVNNVVPTIALAGTLEVNTGEEYSLNLGAVTDPGDDTVTSYIVDWGDGSSDTFNTAGDVTHTYVAAGSNTISVDLVDEDGTHTAGTQELTVIGNNNPPVAQDDTFVTDENVAVSGNLLADNGNGVDSDPDGDPLTVQATTFETAAGGTVNINTDGTFEYTPLLNFSGVDGFEYTLLDDQGNDDIGSVSITINEPPMNEIIGTTGRDILTGTSVNDLIKSLSGNVDRMTGGEGGDIFVFGAETTNGVRERDIILDYEVGIDAIQLEDGATVGSVRQTSSGVTVFFEGDRDAVFVQGEGVLVGNLTFIPEDIVLL